MNTLRYRVNIIQDRIFIRLLSPPNAFYGKQMDGPFFWLPYRWINDKCHKKYNYVTHMWREAKLIKFCPIFNFLNIYA